MIISINMPSNIEDKPNENYLITPVSSLDSLKLHLSNKIQSLKLEKKKHEYFALRKVGKNKRKVVILTIEITYKRKK